MSPVADPGFEQAHGTQLLKKPDVPSKAAPAEDEALVLNTIRCFAADLCQQFKGGHPGTVMGAAAIGIALWRYQMRFNPKNPDWFARDRFVLSVGHACLLQYIMLHFSGYDAWTVDAIKQYHAPVTDGIAAGHPEIEFPGVECTTGPLGQGIANAVGLAIAGKQISAKFDKDGFPVAGQKIWAMTGDGCLQEGVGQEAISLAGHFGLDNLILVYDNNAVTVDGNIDACFTDDTSAKLRAMGWETIDVYDGSNNLTAIVEAFDKARAVKGKPVLVNIRTIIGIGSQKQNTGSVHGQALGDSDVAYVKTQLGFNPDDKFVIPPKVYDYFRECIPKGQKLEEEWNAMMAKYAEKYPKEYQELQRRREGKLADGWETKLPSKTDLPSEAIPTRKASGIVVQALVPQDETFVAGSADLLESTFVNFKGQVEFQKPDGKAPGDYTGRQIRYGIREFAMVAIGNGLAAYQRGMFVPIMSTFFMFWLYAAPAVRMSCLQKLRFIGIATHDAIGIGEDGPTHQPVAEASLFRAMPNLNFVRPADAEEVMGAWQLALRDEEHPSIFTLSRQPVPLLEGSDRAKVAKGGYVIYGDESATPDITLLATGAEVARSIEVAKLLEQQQQQGGSNKNGASTTVRVVSMPSLSHFDRQPKSYRRQVIPSDRSLVVAIEAWASLPWAKYAHAGAHMHTFGLSAPHATLYEHFGFSPQNLAQKITAWKQGLNGERPGVGDFEELLNGYMDGKHYAGK